jgi:hypothetical protein
MQSDCSLPSSHEPCTCPSPDSTKSSLFPGTIFTCDPLQYEENLPFTSPNQNHERPSILRRAKTSLHLCLIIVMNSRNSSLCNYLKSHATSSVLVPNKFRRTSSRIPPSTFHCPDIKTKFDIHMINEQNNRPRYFNLYFLIYKERLGF